MTIFPSLYTIQELKRSKLLYAPITFDTITKYALIDTGAFACAMPKNILNQILANKNAKCQLQNLERPFYVKVANGHETEVNSSAIINFSLSENRHYQENFLILPRMNSIILGCPFFENNNIKIDLKNRQLEFPDVTVQLNTIQCSDGSFKRTYPKNEAPLLTAEKTTIQPNSLEIVKVQVPKKFESQFCNKIGTANPCNVYEEKTGVLITSSLNQIKGNETFLSILNLNPHPITIPQDTLVARFSILTLTESNYLKPIPPELLTLPEADFENNISALFEKNAPPNYRFDDAEWFPTPQNCPDPTNLNPIERKIFNQLTEFRKMETIDPKNNENDRKFFLSQFDFFWKSIFRDRKIQTL